MEVIDYVASLIHHNNNRCRRYKEQIFKTLKNATRRLPLVPTFSHSSIACPNKTTLAVTKTAFHTYTQNSHSALMQSLQLRLNSKKRIRIVSLGN